MSNGIFKLPMPVLKDLSYTPDNFRIIAEGQTWGLTVLDDMLLAGRHDGFFQVSDDALLPVAKGTGYWTFNQVKNQASSIIIAGNYQGLGIFESTGNLITEKSRIGNFNESARFIVVDRDNTIWVSHPYRGVYKVQLSEAGQTNVRLYTKEKGLPSSLNNHVYKIRNKVLIATEKGVYEYDARNDLFKPSPYFGEIFGQQSVRYLKEDTNGNIWFVQDKAIGVVDYSDVKAKIIYLPELQGKILSGFEYVYPLDENNVFVGGEKGFYHINYEKYKESNRPLNVYIRKVISGGKNDTLIYGGYDPGLATDSRSMAESIPHLAYDNSSLHFEYSSPLFDQISNLEYSYYLTGFDQTWSGWSKKTEKDYTSLPPGRYTFNVKVRNNLMGESSAAVYSFVVVPPWYKTWWARIAYILIAALIGVLLYQKHKKKLSETDKTIVDRLHKASKLSADQIMGFLAALDFSDCGSGSSVYQKARSYEAIARLGDLDGTTQFAKLKEMVGDRMLPANKGMNTLYVTDILYNFNFSALSDMLPVRNNIEVPEKLVLRQQLSALQGMILDPATKVMGLHGAAGIGKSTIMLSVDSLLPAGSKSILFDCYGGGAYNDADDRRHTPEYAFLQLCNELALQCGTPFLLVHSLNTGHLLKELKKRLTEAVSLLQAVNPTALLALLIDAADNSVSAAQQFHTECFVTELARMGLPEGCRIIFSARTERLL
ncbi:MAG: hypothetical protein EOO02_15255, partial [Chitinophagaceae bacterium]